MQATAFLTATRERTNDMQTVETQEPTKETTPRKAQPLMAVVAFLVVIALGIAAALIFQGSDDADNVSAPPFDTPQDALEAYYAVVNDGDGDAYVALFADGASDGSLANGVDVPDEKIKARVEAMAAYGVTSVVEDCVEETELRAKCTVAVDDPIQGLVTGIREWELSVVLTIDEAGLIERIGVSAPPQGEVDTDRIDALVAFMTENYPELFNEVTMQLWGPDPLERSGAEIARDDRAAVEEFDAQYNG
jgi:hypothetical protein